MLSPPIATLDTVRDWDDKGLENAGEGMEKP